MDYDGWQRRNGSAFVTTNTKESGHAVLDGPAKWHDLENRLARPEAAIQVERSFTVNSGHTLG